jgi:hypothetical protein
MRNTARIIKRTALKPITTSFILKAVSFNANNLSKLFIYNLLFNLEFKTSELFNIGLLKL